MTKVIRAYPPNYTWLKDVFPIQGRQGIIYAHGDRIYNPNGVKMEPWIMAHEEEHCKRQNEYGVGAWWDAYATNKAFRLEEEVLAHRVEYRAAVAAMSSKDLERHFARMKERLASPLYGSMCSEKEAAGYILAW